MASLRNDVIRLVREIGMFFSKQAVLASLSGAFAYLVAQGNRQVAQAHDPSLT